MTISKSLSSALLTFLLFGCSVEQSPSQVYVEYNSRVMAGMSFDDEKLYFSKKKQQEVESKMPQYMKQMNKSRDEVITVYLEFTKGLARCKEISLLSETIATETASLEFSQRDVCGNESTSTEKQVVKMVKEGGWKIDDVVISL
ncbi:MAG: hypothetical protein COA75_08450 [Cellvibrionales bacterium]|nr:MAG: hypothetical protein COA75_08450 [Cellvibrionales bacterium]